MNTSNIAGSSTLLQEPPLEALDLNTMNDDISPQKPPIDTEANKPSDNFDTTTPTTQTGVIGRALSCLKSRRKRKVGPGIAQKRKNGLRINYCEFLLSCFRKKPKVKAIEKGSRQIMLKLDFLLIFKRLTELERLKRCLMTQDQQILFHSIQKPILNVSLEDKKKRKKAKGDEGEEDSELDEESCSTLSELKEAYLNLRKGGCRTIIDRNLVFNYERNRDAIEAMTKR